MGPHPHMVRVTVPGGCVGSASCGGGEGPTAGCATTPGSASAPTRLPVSSPSSPATSVPAVTEAEEERDWYADEVDRLLELLTDVANSAATDVDPRLDTIELQVDRETWAALGELRTK